MGTRQSYRTAEARQMARLANSLGYEVGQTATGHLRCIHKTTGKLIIAPSKLGGAMQRNAEAELRRGATVETQ